MAELSDVRAGFFLTPIVRFAKPLRVDIRAAYYPCDERLYEFPTEEAQCHHHDRDGGRGQVDLCTAPQFPSAHRQPLAAALHPQSRSCGDPCPV